MRHCFKNKGAFIDLRINKAPMAHLIINNIVVERITSFKLLGSQVTTCNEFTWDLYCDFLLLKARQRLCFLRKSKFYNVRKTILMNFYRAIIESIHKKIKLMSGLIGSPLNISLDYRH